MSKAINIQKLEKRGDLPNFLKVTLEFNSSLFIGIHKYCCKYSCNENDTELFPNIGPNLDKL